MTLPETILLKTQPEPDSSSYLMQICVRAHQSGGDSVKSSVGNIAFLKEIM